MLCQVRRFYNSIIKKINRLFNGFGYTVDKHCMEDVAHALVCYSMLRRKVETQLNDENAKKKITVDAQFASSLHELMTTG